MDILIWKTTWNYDGQWKLVKFFKPKKKMLKNCSILTEQIAYNFYTRKWHGTSRFLKQFILFWWGTFFNLHQQRQKKKTEVRNEKDPAFTRSCSSTWIFECWVIHPSIGIFSRAKILQLMIMLMHTLQSTHITFCWKIELRIWSFNRINRTYIYTNVIFIPPSNEV